MGAKGSRAQGGRSQERQEMLDQLCDLERAGHRILLWKASWYVDVSSTENIMYKKQSDLMVV